MEPHTKHVAIVSSTIVFFVMLAVVALALFVFYYVIFLNPVPGLE